MKCYLCGTAIQNYNPAFHQLKIDESHTADICQVCIDKFVIWQQGKFARLFPTTAAKKRFKKS
ncbi:MAG: hypothetical protein PHW04_16420 [Candidatus Wallbacteria bacterium]|nr:hypothetical protein [Candidatus Wallbacteria bacterium]